MSAVVAAVHPLLKVRQVARDRIHGASWTRNGPATASMVNQLDLGWCEDAVRMQRDAGKRLDALGEQIDDLALLVRGVLVGGEVLPAEVEMGALGQLMIFSKLEAARGLLKQAQALLVLACLAILLGLAVQLTGEDEQAMRRAPRALRVRTSAVRVAARRVEGAA